MSSHAWQTPDKAEPTVFVVDDDEALRRSLQFQLTSAGYPVETFGSAKAFLDSGAPTRPGCLLLDVQMPGMSGLDLQELLLERRIAMPVVILTAYASVPMAVRAMQAGAMDFIEKPFEGSAVLARVRQALANVDRRQADQHRVEEIRRQAEELTPRERQVMDLVIAGMLNKQIAGELDISIKTVESHRKSVMTKMHAESLAELVRLALEADLSH